MKLPTRTALLLTLAFRAAFASDPPPKPVRLTTDGLPKHRPAWSPDGKRLAFARHEDGGLHIRQYVAEASDLTKLKRLTARKDPEYDAVFTPDGKGMLLVVVNLSGTQGKLDVARAGFDGGEPKMLTEKIDDKLSHQEWPAPSPDGQRFAFSSTHDGNQEIYTARLDGSDVVRVTQNPGTDAHPCWTPDGKSLIFATDRWGGLELARSNPDGTGLTRLTTSPGLDDYPAVSPDGKRLAFVSNRDGQFEVYVSDINGSAPHNISNHPGRDSLPTWTSDGKAVTFVSGRESVADLYSIAVDR